MLLGYLTKRINYFSLLENNTLLIYQLGYILDKNSLFKFQEMNEFIFNLILIHKISCEDNDCKIYNLKSVILEDVYIAFISEINHIIQIRNRKKEEFTNIKDLESMFIKEKGQIKVDYISGYRSHRKYLKKNDNLEYLLNIIHFYKKKYKEKKFKDKDMKKLYHAYEFDIAIKKIEETNPSLNHNYDDIDNKNVRILYNNHLNTSNISILDNKISNQNEKKPNIGSFMGSPFKSVSINHQVNKLNDKDDKNNSINNSDIINDNGNMDKKIRKSNNYNKKNLKSTLQDKEMFKDVNNQISMKERIIFNEENNKNSNANLSNKTNMLIEIESKEKKDEKNHNYFKKSIIKNSKKSLREKNFLKDTILSRYSNHNKRDIRRNSNSSIFGSDKKLFAKNKNRHPRSSNSISGIDPIEELTFKDTENNQKNKKFSGNLIKIMYNSYKYIHINSTNKNQKPKDNNLLYIMNIVLKEHFKDNYRQYINFKLILYYIEILKDIFEACDLLNNIIELFNNNNYSGIFEMSSKLCNIDLRVQKTFKLLTSTKNKNFFTDIYSLFTIKYLFEETFNKNLQSDNNLIFSPDMNKLIVENYISDNFIILKSMSKENNSHIRKTNYNSNFIKNKNRNSSNANEFDNSYFDYTSETFQIIKGTRFFIKNLNKTIDCLFPNNIKNEISENFVNSVYESNGVSFNYKTIFELNFSILEEGNKENYEKDHNHNDKGIYLLDNQDITSTENLYLENNPDKNKIRQGSTLLNKKLGLNYSEETIKLNQHFLKTAKLNCKIFPSLDIRELIVFVDISFFDEETIIFEQDSNDMNKVEEHLNNLSPILSNEFMIPLDILKKNTKNKISFKKLFQLGSNKFKRKFELLKKSTFVKNIFLKSNYGLTNENEIANEEANKKSNLLLGLEKTSSEVSFSNGNIGNFFNYKFDYKKFLNLRKNLIEEANFKISKEENAEKLFKYDTLKENQDLNVEIALFHTIYSKNSMYRIFQIKLLSKEQTRKKNTSNRFIPIMDYFQDNNSVDMSFAASDFGSAQRNFNIKDQKINRKYIDRKRESQSIKKYLILILIIIGLFIIAEIVILIIGINLIISLHSLLEMGSNFNLFSSFFFETQLSIFIKANIYFEKSKLIELNYINDFFEEKFYKKGIDKNVLNLKDYLIEALLNKLEIYKVNSQSFKNLVFSFYNKEISASFYNRKLKMFYMSITKKNRLLNDKEIDFLNDGNNIDYFNERNSQKLIERKLQLKNQTQMINIDNEGIINNISIGESETLFFDMVDIYLTYYKIMTDKNHNETISFYIIDNSQDKISFKNFHSKKISRPTIAFYHLILNYENIYKSFEYYKNILITNTINFLEFIRLLIVNISLIFLVLHFILIIIIFLTLKLFNDIIIDNINMMDIMLYKEKKDLLQKQFRELKKLTLLYSENPYEIMKKLKNEKQKLIDFIILKERANARRVNNFSNNSILMDNANDNNKIPKLDKKTAFNNKKTDSKMKLKNVETNKYAKFLIFIFLIYNTYWVLTYFVFANLHDKVCDSYRISTLVSDTFQLSVNNVILLNLKTILNQTDFKMTKFFSIDDTIITNINNVENFYSTKNNQNNIDNFNMKNNNTNLYLRNNINLLYERLSELNILVNKNSNIDLINKFFLDDIYCEKIYLSYGDSTITNMANLIKNNFNQTYEKNLIKSCEQYPFMNAKSLYNIYQELSFISNKLYNKIEQSDRSYFSLKRLYENNLFYELYTIILLILSPIKEYIVKNLSLFYLHGVIDGYIYFIILYLIFNCFLDLIILLITYRNVIRNVNDINDNFEVIMDCLKH